MGHANSKKILDLSLIKKVNKFTQNQHKSTLNQHEMNPRFDKLKMIKILSFKDSTDIYNSLLNSKK